MDELHFPFPHIEDPDIFREALSFTEATIGFTASLIEKDYYCSQILRNFFESGSELIFKGGTCISKIYTEFYRLSEDLDFVIPVSTDSSRKYRRAMIEPFKRLFQNLPSAVQGVAIAEPFSGYNESRQYIGYFEYSSSVIEKKETIKIEIGLREPLFIPYESRPARTIASNPFSNRSLLPTFNVQAMSIREAYAEKFRAALSRRAPAIRDFFDLFYAAHEIELNFQDPAFVKLVKSKLEVPGNSPIDVSIDRKQELEKQTEGQLRPVLRPQDYTKFDLDEALELVYAMAKAVSAEH